MSFTLWRGIVGMVRPTARCLLFSLRLPRSLRCSSEGQSQVAVLIGTTSGGGYDLYAQALARHIGRHLPGQPAVIAKNVPGAGG
jgi:tripartite-type tricarboxylate transporter receptor subunit TctC